MAQLADEEAVDELRELEPSPVEETPVDSAKDDYFPTSKISSKPRSDRSNTSTLGLGNHSLNFYLLRVQRYSSYAFSLFAVAHVTNTSLLPLLTRSLPASDTYLLLTRPYYQSTLAEPLLIGLPLALHIASGLTLRLRRRRRLTQDFGASTRAERRTIAWPALSGTSALGYALAPLVAMHVFVNRAVPLKVAGGSSDVGLKYVGHGFTRFPALSWSVYVALVGVGVWHGVWGWARWMGFAPGQVRVGGGDGVVERKRRWWVVNGAAGVVAMLWGAGGLGVVGRGGLVGGWLGKEYDELYRYVPILGRLI
ncbi:MAG: hypothetical protein M1821_001404 [Bathelium mastoideum]|nr:MAG: hypothetical protein M1821_001404 [Bathelium mastoideum]